MRHKPTLSLCNNNISILASLAEKEGQRLHCKLGNVAFGSLF